MPRHQLGACGVPNSRLVNRNVIAERGRTSMRLEPEFWSALQEICRRERLRMGTLIRQIEERAQTDQADSGGRTSAVRVFVLQYFRAAPTARPQAVSQERPTPSPAPSPTSSYAA